MAGRIAVLSLLLHGLRPHQCREGCGQVPAEQRLLRRNIQQQGQRLGGEARFKDLWAEQIWPQSNVQHERHQATGVGETQEVRDSYDEAAVDAAPPQVRGEFSQVDGSQPLHHAMVGPLHHL